MVRSLRPGRGQNSRRQPGIDNSSPLKKQRVTPSESEETAEGDHNGDPDSQPDDPMDADPEQANVAQDDSESTQVKDAPQETPIEQLQDKVRRSVAEALKKLFTEKLVTKAVNAGDLKLPADMNVDEYSEQLSVDIEAALYEHHANKPVSARSKKAVDVGQRYREKFRTLSFNLRDEKNGEFHTQVVTRQLSPEACATLSSDQMLNPELRRLADEVRKESIRESVLKVDDAQNSAPRVRKTHKGEEVVEHDDVELGPEPEIAVPGTFSGRDFEEPREENPHAPQPPSSIYYNSNFDGVSYEPEEGGHGYGSSGEDSSEQEKPAEMRPVWEGSLMIGEKPKFFGTALHLGGMDSDVWSAVLSGNTTPLQLIGRADSREVDQYLKKLHNRACFASFALVSDDNANVTELAGLLSSQKSVGALRHDSAIIKDAFLLPLLGQDGHEAAPAYLGLDASSQRLLSQLTHEQTVLIGIYVLPKV